MCSNFPSFIIGYRREKQCVASAMNCVFGRSHSKLKMLIYISQETPLLSEHVKIGKGCSHLPP